MNLKPEESSKLSLIVQYRRLKRARPDLEQMIKELGPKAKKIGRILLGEDGVESTEEERETAEAYKSWHQTNVRLGGRRGSTASRRAVKARLLPKNSK